MVHFNKSVTCTQRDGNNPNPTKLAGKKILFKVCHLAERHFILLKDDLWAVSSATGSGTSV